MNFLYLKFSVISVPIYNVINYVNVYYPFVSKEFYQYLLKSKLLYIAI